MATTERVLAVLDERSPDRGPWIARPDLWCRARLAEGNLAEHTCYAPCHEASLAYERAERSSELVEEHGAYPVQSY